MPKLKVLSSKDITKMFSDFGFEHINTKGSHIHMRYRGILATIPLSAEIPKGTLKAIYRQAAIVIPKAELDAMFYTK
ncbi:MAG: hypothetical protein RIT04_286 [Candidatus Parcubacteria bacterium]|jgi:predicted RNA binding protein YcfA (HicA-like mRNA interferase family)